MNPAASHIEGTKYKLREFAIYNLCLMPTFSANVIVRSLCREVCMCEKFGVVDECARLHVYIIIISIINTYLFINSNDLSLTLKQ